MKKSRFSLWMRLTLLILLGIIITVSFLFYRINQQIIETNQLRQEKTLLELGHFLARDQQVIAALKSETSTPEIQQLTQAAEKDFGLDFVVVMTMAKIRLTHPNPEKIYQPFEGGDEELAVTKGVETVSTATGTLGQSLRGFVPVFDRNKDEIGVISIGMTTTRLSETLAQARKNLTLSLCLSLFISLMIAVFTAFTLKRQMHDLEPKEIGILLEERNAMFQNLHDGVIVTNQRNEVTLVNQAGIVMIEKLAHTSKPFGKQIASLIPIITEFQSRTKTITDEIYQQNGVDYLISVAPIVVRKQQVGQILMIRDMTDLTSLHEQLINTTAYASSLQSQSHDFLNKLHVIYGLSDIGDAEALQIYLQKILEPEQEFSSRMVYLIHNPIIAGFLIGERSRFLEKQLPFMVEIYPDIPPSSNQKKVQLWMNMVRVIHDFLLNQTLKQFAMRLGYQNKQLELVYTLPNDDFLIPELKTLLHTKYFDNLLKTTNGRFALENQGQAYKLSLTLPYISTKEEENDIPNINY
ncbi:Spo0B domain-containing protein [Vagococcus salmoninarum]|uniref:Spo0B domain-containing protein n=1 Tax=Vagococcus salmoninarum TaxID=2739 RepID=UPI00188248BA|nr:sensor histidine kinase [Vagococcus salmoninarum]MBE9389537.1 sensor histidine kinase [Vagococcus salmoninarum]